MATPTSLAPVAVIGNGADRPRRGPGLRHCRSLGAARRARPGQPGPGARPASARASGASPTTASSRRLPLLGSWRASNRRPHSTTPAPDLVVEGILEDQARKLAIFEPLDQICPCPAVLASSSGRPVSRLAERVRRRDRPEPLRLATPRATPQGWGSRGLRDRPANGLRPPVPDSSPRRTLRNGPDARLHAGAKRRRRWRPSVLRSGSGTSGAWAPEDGVSRGQPRPLRPRSPGTLSRTFWYAQKVCPP